MHATICICTRDRGAGIECTLRSLAALSHDDFDVVIVDQSTTDETGQAIHRLVGTDSRFTYTRSITTGKSVGLNIALTRARGPLVAFTDDDCEVPSAWLAVLESHFAAHLEVGLIFGEVRAAPHDADHGFVPTYDVPRGKRVSSPWLKWREGGIGANAAFRLSVLLAVGPYDELLGPGAPFPNCEDGDMTYRVLRAGHAVLNVPDAYVIHSGYRAWDDGRRLMHGTGLAIGAAYMKHLRLGDLAVLPTLVCEWMRSLSWKRLLLLRRHSGIGRFLWYARGMQKSFHYVVDRRQRVYVASADMSDVSSSGA